MKIAIDTSPLDPNSGHSVRGVGSYLRSITENIQKIDKKNEYLFFSDRKIPKSADLVHIPYFDPFRLEIPIRKIKKCIITIHDLTPVLFPEHFPAGLKGSSVWKFQKNIIRKSAGIITDSKSSQEDVHRIAGISKENIFPIHLSGSKNYYSVKSKSEITSVINKYNLPEKFALYIGDVTWNKNVPFIIESCIATNIPLVLVGRAITDTSFDASNAWNRDRVIIQKHFELNKGLLHPLGFVEDHDLNFILNAAQVLLMPSRYEGFGLPVLEAMQTGCPVITSRNGSLEEVGGDAVLYVDSDNKDELARKIEEIFKNGNLREELKQKGIQQSKKFTIEKMIHGTILAYEAIGKKI